MQYFLDIALFVILRSLQATTKLISQSQLYVSNKIENSNQDQPIVYIKLYGRELINLFLKFI